MTTAREIMTADAVCVGGNETLADAARKLRDLDVTIGADDDVSEALATMKEHKVRRLPVIDGHRLVGMLSQADIARNLPDDRVGDLVEYISE